MDNKILKALVEIVKYVDDFPEEERTIQFNKALENAYLVIKEAMPDKTWVEILDLKEEDWEKKLFNK